jgi:hypothetical protein
VVANEPLQLGDQLLGAAERQARVRLVGDRRAAQFF